MKISTLKKVFVGRPLATAQARHERLSNWSALAVFASDALSSVAYATEEILLILVLGGTIALGYAVPIGFAICLLIAVVTSSYRQTIRAYPQGGGAYIVTKDNLGTLPSLVAGAALLVDYVLTVAVSVAAGIAALTSAFPALYDYRVVLGVLCIAIISTANLRGLRESGALFALPTYLFIASFLGMLGLRLCPLAVRLGAIRAAPAPGRERARGDDVLPASGVRARVHGAHRCRSGV